ncbi:methyltransferase mt-, putative [Ichthyophthirius multifiliis]|uniref:Methyltransferase mt-, putative n=1 Tax=Ichthyophthirius multifiliis TaxID=5932 RepID=G0QZE6_ICHMU|nr:methyltransferase mt-, putative [Ichthyophthirius multifiliis]EGR29415.1 methyltransferase mt-, putative [Ichthyophthirius multifiliis]|eukprot:XP_004030651.1 methyltransferase mt-, putative [Ichthyophthirius multifiliis]
MVAQLNSQKSLEIQRKKINQNKEKKITDFFKRLQPNKSIWDSLTPQQIVIQEKYPEINNVVEIFLNEDDNYFKRAKKVILMFRKFNKDAQLELRHQRTSDVFFDIFNEQKPDDLSQKGMQFIYKMIETLLPKANYSEDNKQSLKLMELWANPEILPQKGWIRIIENEQN